MNSIDNTSGTVIHGACPGCSPAPQRREYRPRILFLGSVYARAGTFARMLRRWGYAVSLCEPRSIHSATFRQEAFDLVVVHLERLDFDVWDSLDSFRRNRPSIPMIILREHLGECSWVELGGASWILKTQLTMAQTQMLFHELAGVPASERRAPSIRCVDRSHGPFPKTSVALHDRPRWAGFGTATLPH